MCLFLIRSGVVYVCAHKGALSVWTNLREVAVCAGIDLKRVGVNHGKVEGERFDPR